ncbi:MAG: bifunctional 3-phosphoshikimate 1-carboxyvinyltransferase/cytidylate kinase [Burkholderiaceae bacterium]
MFAIPFIDIPVLRSAGGVVHLPGSKSISNRVLLLAALSAGETRIHDLLESDDTQVMLTALAQLGCAVRTHEETPGRSRVPPIPWGGPTKAGALAGAQQRVVTIGGLGGRLRTRDAALFLGNAGTAMRPLCAALAVLAARQGGRFDLSGVPRMHERPIGDLVSALHQLGCNVAWLGKVGYPPLRISGADAVLRKGSEDAPLRIEAPIRVRGDVSSQFLSALLLALPLVGSEQAITIEVDGELISRPYVEITVKLLARFGIRVEIDAWRRFVIAPGSEYRSPGDIHVEGDASSASYFIALGAIAASTESSEPLRIVGVGKDSIQGDIAFVDAARAMGADINCAATHLEVRRGTFPLNAIELDCQHLPDAAMTLAVMALFARGTTRLSNIASWRVKETDRIAAMATELRKLGAHVGEGADFIEITAPKVWRAATIHTYDDHRMAMCFSLAACTVPVRIVDPQCVAKTFPDYFETLFSVVRADEADIPVITVDGPTASGKGTLASAVAQRLGYHYLDSGAAYRATALRALRRGIAADDEAGLAQIAAHLDLLCLPGQTCLSAEDVTEALRLEEVGALASKISAWPKVRAALRDFQLQHRRVPGLVADGRDMGTVIFPGADLKVFLTASAATRLQRRHKQLITKGISATIDALRAELEARDQRDQSRAVSPLKPAQDAMLLDNSALSVDASVDAVLSAWQQRRPFG